MRLEPTSGKHAAHVDWEFSYFSFLISPVSNVVIHYSFLNLRIDVKAVSSMISSSNTGRNTTTTESVEVHVRSIGVGPVLAESGNDHPICTVEDTYLPNSVSGCGGRSRLTRRHLPLSLSSTPALPYPQHSTCHSWYLQSLLVLHWTYRLSENTITLLGHHDWY